MEVIRNKFDDNAEINSNTGNIIIKFSTLVIKEIRNHYNLQNLKLNSIKIIVNNIKDDYSSFINPIKQITYDIDHSGIYVKTMVYKNGNTIVSKLEKI